MRMQGSSTAHRVITLGWVVPFCARYRLRPEPLPPRELRVGCWPALRAAALCALRAKFWFVPLLAAWLWILLASAGVIGVGLVLFSLISAFLSPGRIGPGETNLSDLTRAVSPAIRPERRKSHASRGKTRCPVSKLLVSSDAVLAQVNYIPNSVQPWLDDARWWLRNPAYSNPRLRVGARTLPEVVDALRAVYDEATCRGLIERGYWAPMLGLFSGAPWIEWSGVMLAVGLDLVDAAAMNETWLVGRLRAGGDQWLGARLELGAFAGLKRHGLAPRRCTLRPDLPQWDFDLDIDSVSYAVECKTLASGNDDGNFDHVEQRFQNFVVEFGMEPRCNATFAISDELRGLLHDLQVQPFYEQVMPELTEDLRRALAASDLDGVPVPAGRLGTVSRSSATNDDGFLGQWIVTGYASTNFHRQRRLVNSFASATANFVHTPGGSHRVAVVWLGKDYLDCASLARRISDNLGESLREDGVSVSLDAGRFGYETGVALGAARHPTAAGWLHDRGMFHLGARSRDVYRIYDAVSAWSYHVMPRG